MSTDFENRIQVIERINDVPVIFYTEQKLPSKKEKVLLWNYMEEVSAPNGDCYFIIDVSSAAPPNAEVRAQVKKNLRLSKVHFLHSYIIPGSNLFVKFGLKFVLASMGLGKFTVVKTKEDALSLIKK